MKHATRGAMDRFEHYTRDELVMRSAQLIDAINRVEAVKDQPIGNVDWTEAVLDCFANSAFEHATVDGRPSRRQPHGRRGAEVKLTGGLAGIAGSPRTTFGEYLFDLSHSSYPAYGTETSYRSDAYWAKALATPPEIYLVLESEWGKAGATTFSLSAVMEDASKLLHVCARVKVVLFASTTEENRERVLNLAGTMVRADVTRTNSGAAPTWLWIDVPWSWVKHQPKCWISSGSKLEEVR